MKRTSKVIVALGAGLLLNALLATRVGAKEEPPKRTRVALADRDCVAANGAVAALAGTTELVPLPDVLLAGATTQKLELKCETCGGLTIGSFVRLRLGAKEIRGQVEEVGTSRIVLALGDVPREVDPGNWDLIPGMAANAATLHTVKLDVVKAPVTVAQDPSTNTPLLGVHYGVKVGDRELDQYHSERAVGGQAVVTPGKGEFRQYIKNVATLQPSEALRALAQKLAALQARRFPEKCAPTPCDSSDADECAEEKKYRCDELERKLESVGPDYFKSDEDAWIDECRAPRHVWRVKNESWDKGTVFYEYDWWYVQRGRFDVLGSVGFATFESQQAPFDVEVSLVTVDPAKPTEETTIFSTRVRLANGARVESLPLPLARALYLICGNGATTSEVLFKELIPRGRGIDVARNGTTHAVNDEDLVTGQCRLRYSSALLLEALEVPNTDAGRDLLKYFGPQQVQISVAHGDSADQTKTVPIDPAVDEDLYLPRLPAGKKIDGLYTVSARPLNPLPPAVLYRGQTTPNGPGAAASADELEFRVSLRPRGPYGWQRVPLRMFATFPVNVTGVRFPAATSEIRTSSSPIWGQVTPVQVGALFAVEPWDYNTGRNLWPVPVRFATGLHLFDLSEGTFAPSWVTGVSITLPIVNLQKGTAEDQLGTDVALGMFWEVDLRERQPMKYGHHGLLTLGVNVLSLFGSK